MKTPILISVIVAGALAAPIVAAQDKHVHDKPGMSMDMDKHMSQMQERMKSMQQQMEIIRATSDPVERAKLEQAMHQNMQAMCGMGGPMAMGSSAPGGMKQAGHKHMEGGDMMRHHHAMHPMSAHSGSPASAGGTASPTPPPVY